MSKVISIIGPTAIGKTDLAIELYKNSLDFCSSSGVNTSNKDSKPIDIISVDSAMVYKKLNIGTGKPSKEILEQIPHGLINIRDIESIYSVADFCIDAKNLIKKSHQNSHIPLLVGGTMMYFNALFNGLSTLPSSDKDIREKLNHRVEKEGLEVLYKELNNIDSKYAAKINQNDKQRITRALEVYLISNIKYSDYIKHNSSSLSSGLFDDKTLEQYNIFLLPTDRLELHKRIAARFHKMLADGFIEEVGELYNSSQVDTNISNKANLYRDLPAIRSVGYRQAWSYLSGEISKEEMIERSIIATRQLAKRQHTWIRGMLNKSVGSNVDNMVVEIDFNKFDMKALLSKVENFVG